jgi:phage gp29-like protein
MPKTTPLTSEIVTRAASFEGDIWGYLPDPDPILTKLGADVLVFERLLADAHVFACYQSRKAGVLTSEFRIEYPNGTEKMSKLFDKMVVDLDMDRIVAQLLDAPFYGFSVNEVLWNSIDGKWLPGDIQQKPNNWFVFDKENRIRFLCKKNWLEGILLPEFKFLVPRNFPTYENPYGIRALSRCFWPVTFKKLGYKYWNMFMEKFGIPWLFGKVPRGSTTEERQAMLEMLEAMIQSAVAVINDDESVDALAIAQKQGGAGSDNIFNALVNSANGEISKAILTQTLTTEIGDKGAYAASQSHLSIRVDICSMDKKLVAAAFKQLFKWVADLNFAGAENAPYLKFVEEDDAKEAHSRRDSQLSSQGVRFKPQYYIRTYNLRADEFEVKESNDGQVQTTQEKEEVRKDKRLEKRQDPKQGTKDKE